MYYSNIIETEQDIYFNSVIRYSGKDYKDNEEIYTYLIDKRFIIDLGNLISFLKRNYIIEINEFDKCFVILKINSSQDYVDMKILFNRLLEESIIISIQDFIIQYNVKPRYGKGYNPYKDQL